MKLASSIFLNIFFDNWAEKYCEKENKLFFKSYVASLLTFFEKGRVIWEFSFLYVNDTIYV